MSSKLRPHIIDYLPKLKNIAGSFTRDRHEREDLEQEIALRLLQNEERFDPGRGQPATFINAVARNQGRNHLRRGRAQINQTQSLTQEVEDSPQDERFSSEHITWVLDQLQHLTPSQRQAVKMRYLEGMAVKDVAAALDCDPSTVSSHLGAALRKLKHRASRQGLLSFFPAWLAIKDLKNKLLPRVCEGLFTMKAKFVIPGALIAVAASYSVGQLAGHSQAEEQAMSKHVALEARLINLKQEVQDLEQHNQNLQATFIPRNPSHASELQQLQTKTEHVKSQIHDLSDQVKHVGDEKIASWIGPAAETINKFKTESGESHMKLGMQLATRLGAISEAQFKQLMNYDENNPDSLLTDDLSKVMINAIMNDVGGTAAMNADFMDRLITRLENNEAFSEDFRQEGLVWISYRGGPIDAFESLVNPLDGQQKERLKTVAFNDIDSANLKQNLSGIFFLGRLGGDDSAQKLKELVQHRSEKSILIESYRALARMGGHSAYLQSALDQTHEPEVRKSIKMFLSGKTDKMH